MECRDEALLRFVAREGDKQLILQEQQQSKVCLHSLFVTYGHFTPLLVVCFHGTLFSVISCTG